MEETISRDQEVQGTEVQGVQGSEDRGVQVVRVALVVQAP